MEVRPVRWGTKEEEDLPQGPGGRVLPSKGLFARHRINAGQRVLVEAPLVAAPHFARTDAFQEWLSRKADPSTATRVLHEDVCAYCLKSLVGPAMALPPPDRDNSDYALPLVERKTPVFWPTAPPRECGGCQSMRQHGAYEHHYCSPTCEQHGRAEYHDRLCPSRDPSHPFTTYQRIARELENPFLIQVARLYPVTLRAFDSIQRAKPTSDFGELWQLSPLSKFAGSYEVVPLFEGVDMARAKRFIYEGEGVSLLKEALYKDDRYDRLFTPETFAWVYNIVQMNCSAIRPKSPWEVYVSNVQKIRPTQTLEVVVGHIMNLAELFARKYELSEEERSLTIFHLLSRSTGNGLYVLHSCMNHSCEPNIEVHNEETNANVHLVAKRPIEPDEELSIDYAGFRSAKWQLRSGHPPGGLPRRDERQRFLHSTFGFTCFCPKCQAEARAT